MHRDQIKNWTLSFRTKGKLNFETFNSFGSSHSSCCELELLPFKYGFRFLKISIFTINFVLATKIVIFPPKS